MPAQVYGLLQEGRYQEAGRLLTAPNRDRDSAAEMRARWTVERRAWAEAMNLRAEAAGPEALVTTWFAKGLGAARAAWPGGRAPEMAVAREAARQLETIAHSQGLTSSPAELGRALVLAGMAAAQEEREELALLLTHALAIESRLSSAAGPALLLPAHEVAGDLWLQVHRYPDAQREFTEALRRFPGRARSMFGLATAMAEAGDVEGAAAQYGRFLEAWARADRNRPELATARTYVERARGQGAARVR